MSRNSMKRALVLLVFSTPGLAIKAQNQTVQDSILDQLKCNMIAIDSGSFIMGCALKQEADCFDDEKPSHTVAVSSFRMGKYEVIQAEWEAVMGSNPSYFQNCPTCPVEQVSWDDIQIFLRKLNGLTGVNYRLPTEAEWEYAARGGNRSSGTLYSGSDSLGAVAWYDANSGEQTHPAGQKHPNVLGLCDMSGNVWEWCSDWFDRDYYKYSPSNSPSGPDSSTYRVIRGGSLTNDAVSCRVSYRDHFNPDARFNNFGFRLVSPVQ